MGTSRSNREWEASLNQVSVRKSMSRFWWVMVSEISSLCLIADLQLWSMQCSSDVDVLVMGVGGLLREIEMRFL